MVPSGQPSQVIVLQEWDGPHTVAYPHTSESSQQVNKDSHGHHKGDVQQTKALPKTAEHQTDLGTDENSVRLSCNGADPLPAKIVRGPESVVAVIGGHVHLGVLFVGTPAPRVTWTKGGKPVLPAGDRVNVSSERHCCSELRIRDACCDDSGKYQVVVENGIGSDSGFASVKVEEITEPPGLPVTMRPGEEFSQNYHVHESVGRGRFGVVHRCTRLADGTAAAAKLVRCTRAAERDRMRHELAILNLLRGHPRLLRLLDAYEKPREVILVTEYVSGGELFERVIADDFVLTEWDCVLFLRQICAGMAYMHSRHVIHLDLKPENILCQSQVGHKIKLIDFGLAQLYEPNSSLRVMFGTPEFVAPEVVSYEPVSPATDMWSVGVICYVLLSGLSPFMGDSDTDTFNNIVRVDFDFDDPVFETISAVAKDFMCQLILKNPRKRMSAEQCLEHEWLCVVPKRGASSLPLPTDKLKKFVVRRKWLKSGNALKALSRMTNMSGQRPATQGDEASVLLACEEDSPVSPPPSSDTSPATVEEEDSSAGDN
ncbi:myosin light chain kinase, smooth muscle-like isoform X2 [Dermacentor andersoni]|uniref:myosin light chain kinase, smooth muscle-like isoform X2 n=1 Tax=Dermacentor andersoni TaxID=34620 RepID=UPI003B3B440A